jgi:hypothetical protein
MVTPVLHLARGLRNVVGQQALQTPEVARVENLATLDLSLQFGPADKSILARERQLCAREGHVRRHRADPPDRIVVASPSSSKQVLRLMAEVIQVGAGWKIGH